MRDARWLLLPVVAGLGAVWAASGRAAGEAQSGTWNPAAFAGESTLEFLTVEPGEGEHWSTVWLVTLDDQLYVRLGSRAAGRIARNTTGPYVGVRIAGRQFDHVRTEKAPEMVDRVAAAMAEKYWLDLLVRFMDHPLTLRLVPEASP
jgi:hypothetical protein